MIQVKLTENYAGVTIFGDYIDLDFLYDSIYYIIKGEPKNILEETMQNHLYGFLYEIRHAYQGNRDFMFVNNELQEEIRAFNKIPKKEISDNNLYYSFDYVVTDLFTDMILVKHFIWNIPKNERDDYNPYLNNIKLFYSCIFNLMKEILSDIKMKKLKEALIDSVISDKLYLPQWFDNITCTYLKQTKEKRVKELSKTLDAIVNYALYSDYCEMKLTVKKYCKENDCLITSVRVCEYPQEIEW